jgi:hypothetical protein
VWSTNNPKVWYALSIISRLICSYYDIEFICACRYVTELLIEIDDGVLLLKGFFIHIVLKERKIRNIRIDTLIVIVDESLVIEEYIFDTFQYKDINKVLRETLLNKSILPHLNVSLVMAGLSPTPFGVTNSGRGFKALRLPQHLDNKKIVDLWWFKNLICEKTVDFPKQVLFFLAEFMNTNPRVCEFAGKFIQQKVDNKSREWKIDQLFMADLLDYVLERISCMYAPEFPSNEMLFAMIYGKSVNQNNALPYVMDSLITNCIMNFVLKKKIMLIPQSSLIMLYASALNKQETSMQEFTKLTIEKIVSRIITFKKDGDALEMLTFDWLKMRIKIAVEIKESELKIKDLFCIDLKNNDINNDIFSVLNTSVKLPKVFDNDEGFFLIYNFSPGLFYYYFY